MSGSQRRGTRAGARSRSSSCRCRGRCSAALEEAIDATEPSHGTMSRGAGERLGASYANFYIGNGLVLMPELDPRTDGEARSILAKLFPDRTVIGLPTREILLGGGNIHCITQQQPAGIPG